MSGSVTQRNGTEIVDQRIIHDDQPVAWDDADARAGFRLDRRKLWAFIKDELHEICRWTQACSGCSYEGDYIMPKRGGGCDECGHQGVVRNAMWIPYYAKDPRP